MAAPNLISATTINGKTTGVILTTTAVTTVLINAVASNKCLKINTLNVANYGTTIANVSVSWYNTANTASTAFAIAGNVSVPTGATLNIIDKSSQYYLEENQCLAATATTGNTLTVTCSYEDIS